MVMLSVIFFESLLLPWIPTIERTFHHDEMKTCPHLKQLSRPYLYLWVSQSGLLHS